MTLRRSLAAIAAFAMVLAAALPAAKAEAAGNGGVGTSAFGNLSPSQPENLQVSGGNDRWHPDNGFRLDWIIPAQAWFPIAAVHFRVRNEAGVEVVPDTRIEWAAELVEGIQLPAPGTYMAEVWLENSARGEGPAAAVSLRFDNSRPAAVKPIAATGWVGRAALPATIHIGHPAGPWPTSGIHGYAVSVDSAPSGDPCAAADRCTDAETDLRTGIAGDSLPLAELSEGTDYVHAVAVSGSGMKSAATGTTVLHVDTTDPVTTLTGAPGGWTNHPVALTATAADVTSGMQPAGSGGPLTAIRIDGGAPTTAPGSSVSATVIGEGTHTIAYYARDGAGNVNDGSGGNGVTNRPPSTATVRIDRAPPSASFLNAQNPQDPESIEARLSDSLSGPDGSRGRIAVRRSAPGEQFEALPTEISAGRMRAHWDSDAYPAGEYEFRATGYDTAGNSATSARRANGSNMVLPNPLKVPTKLEAGFGGKVLAWQRCERHGGRRRCRRQVIASFDRRPSVRLVPYGKEVLFSGRLSAGAGSPLGQMPVQVIERFSPGSNLPDRVTTVQTGADGIFKTRLAPGPSRLVSAAFAGTRTLTRCGAEAVRLGVRAGVRMRPSATLAKVGGRPIVFSGRIESGGATLPADGKTVQLQFRLPGLPWTEFRTLATDAVGHFRYPYRFADDDSRGVRFEFRAFAPAQAGWPYEPASSRPVAVTGR